jgi:hypothetical protein
MVSRVNVIDPSVKADFRQLLSPEIHRSKTNEISGLPSFPDTTRNTWGLCSDIEDDLAWYAFHCSIADPDSFSFLLYSSLPNPHRNLKTSRTLAGGSSSMSRNGLGWSNEEPTCFAMSAPMPRPTAIGMARGSKILPAFAK